MALASLSLGCSSEGAAGDGLQTGSLRVELISGGASGRVYHLNDAKFDIRGPRNVLLEPDPDAPFATVDLPIGSYDIELLQGWTLTPGGENARLVSANPASVEIRNQETTDVVFVFDLTGKAIAFGRGRARISFEVLEPSCGNGELDPGEECDWMMEGEDDCDRDCSGGTKSCSHPSDCASGSCGSYSKCDQCWADEEACGEACHETVAACIDPCRDAEALCGEGCVDGYNSCRGSCDNEFDICVVACGGPINIFCFAACEVAGNSCNDTCATGRDRCGTRCETERETCDGACPDLEACHRGCVEDGSTCRDTCRTCESCRSEGQCPNALEYLDGHSGGSTGGGLSGAEPFDGGVLDPYQD